MNTDILKRNIEQVINQPCIASPWMKGCIKVNPNGLSEDGSYIMVKIRPDDSSWQCNLTGDYVERIVEMLPKKYRDHLVTLRHDEEWISYSYLPVFDTDTQAMWDEELVHFMDAKQAWCDKYGCD
jgi:hypothetical protein